MIAAWLVAGVLAAGSADDDRGFVMAFHDDSKVMQAHVSLQPPPSSSYEASLELPTGEYYEVVDEPTLFPQLRRPVGHAGGVTLKSCHHTIAMPCRLWGGGDFLMGYDTVTRKMKWRIPMDENLFGFNSRLSWYQDRYVVLRRDGHVDGCFAIFDSLRKKEVFSRRWNAGDEYDFQLAPGKVTVKSDSGTETVPF